ncbi:MAG: 16S rRNA (guanine(527)-N(7))-methyltransferase RsmG [Macromonas sp.]
MSAQHPLEAGLRQGLQTLALELCDAQVHTLLAYVDWVAKWNKVYNLTAVRDPQEMLTHHLLDSLAVVAPLQRQLAAVGKAAGATLLDVGSGAGLPGVVVAIACPQVRVSCVDTVAKKALFIQQVAAALRLPNLQGIHARVENLTQTFDVVSSRAFASLVDFTAWSRQALAPDGIWLAMKGKVPHDEVQALPPTVQVFHVEHLTVPGLDAERCVLWLRPAP